MGIQGIIDYFDLNKRARRGIDKYEPTQPNNPDLSGLGINPNQRNPLGYGPQPNNPDLSGLGINPNQRNIPGEQVGTNPNQRNVGNQQERTKKRRLQL